MKLFDENTIILAPMAGITDFAFRSLCKEYGAVATVTEMVSTKALCFNDKKTTNLLKLTRDCINFIQLFGAEGECFSKAIKIIVEELNIKPDVFDINAGCPVPKVFGNGAGCALMQNLDALKDIVSKSVLAADKYNIPVSIKIRSGINKDNINATKVASIAEKEGAACISIHARTRDMFYSGTADKNIIKNVVETVKIPVVGNGDVKNLAQAKKLKEETGCSFVMIGRAALGNPFVFSGEKPDINTIIKTMTKHLSLSISDKGEHTAIKEFRKHIAWYLKGFKNAASLRNKACKINTLEEYYSFIEKMVVS